MNRREFIESVVMATVAAGCRSPFGTSRLGRKDIDLPDDVALAHEGTLGVIGRPGSLSVRATAGRVLAADMAGGEIADVTARCRFADGRLTIPGDVVVEIGSRMNVPGDQSEPGVRIDLVESGRRG